MARTGAIGIIATGGWEKFRGGTRVEFLCGARALARFREWRDALSAATRHLSVTPGELAAAIERLQGDAKSQQRTLRALQEQLAVHEARSTGGAGRTHGCRARSSSKRWTDGTPPTLKALAGGGGARSAVGGGRALQPHRRPVVVVVARGAASQIDAAAVLKALIARFGGKGGGKPEMAQGGGLAADIEAILAEARRLLAG